MLVAGGCDQTRRLGPQLTRALDELSIKVHEEKTVIIIPGETKAAVGGGDEGGPQDGTYGDSGESYQHCGKGSYLGMLLSQGVVKSSIEEMGAQRKGKAWGKIPAIKAIINHLQVLTEGWLGSVAAIFQGIIPPTILYSCKVCTDLTQTFREGMEKSYKAVLNQVCAAPAGPAPIGLHS